MTDRRFSRGPRPVATGLGRSGVPVYGVYLPGRSEPRLLNEILSVPEVLQALGAAT